MAIRKEVRICEADGCGHINEDLQRLECGRCGINISYIPPKMLAEDGCPSGEQGRKAGATEANPYKTQTLQRIKLVGRRDGVEITVPPMGGIIGREGDLEPDYFCHNDFVSRKHARIFFSDAGYYIVDDNSHNGTMINNTLLVKGEKYPLCPGDSIVFANNEFVVRTL